MGAEESTKTWPIPSRLIKFQGQVQAPEIERMESKLPGFGGTPGLLNGLLGTGGGVKVGG